MTKLWMSLGLVNLLGAIGIFVDQRLRFGVWWEWEEIYHHETFIVLLCYATLILFIVASVEHVRNLKRRRKS